MEQIPIIPVGSRLPNTQLESLVIADQDTGGMRSGSAVTPMGWRRCRPDAGLNTVPRDVAGHVRLDADAVVEDVHDHGLSRCGGRRHS